MYLTIMKRIIKKTLILISLLSLFVTAQNLEEKRVDLQDKIEDLKKKIKDEKSYFSKYKSDKEEIIAQKQAELNAIKKENRSYTREITALESEIKNYELKISAVDKRNTKINDRIKVVCEEIKNNLDRIPYNVDRRESVLTSIIMDIESEKASANESFVRLMKFLNSEEMIAYDSQVYENEVKIGEEYKNAEILRIGRIFFAADTGAEVYLYTKQNGKFMLDTDTKLSVFQKQAVKLAVKVIQGKKPPQLVKLPFPGVMIQQSGDLK